VDNSGGTGARTVSIQGLNADYNLVSETVTLAGVSASSATSNSYVHIHRMIVATAGSGLINAGTINAVADTDGTTTTVIAANFGQTQTSIYIIPAGYTAYLSRVEAGAQVAANGTLDVALYAKPFGGAWNIKHDFQFAAGGDLQTKCPHPYPSYSAKTTLRGVATSSTNNADVHMEYDLILVPN
jgi:hypothetical protein